MKLVEFTRDMRPYHAGDAYALPDALADQVIAAGDARPAPGGDAGLAPDDLAQPKAGLSGPGPAPLSAEIRRYHTRKAK